MDAAAWTFGSTRNSTRQGGRSSHAPEDLLAAASFSIFAKRIVFCEGLEGSSLDHRLYTSWFNTDDTAVMPVETSEKVLKRTDSFNEDRVVAGVISLGVVDRDYWPDTYLGKLPVAVLPLKVHEVENLFCPPAVVAAVAEHQGLEPEEAQAKHAEFLSKARARFTGDLHLKRVTERVKRRCEHEFYRALNATDLVSEPATFIRQLDPASWEPSVDKIVKEETTLLSRALLAHGAHRRRPISRY